MSYSVAGGGCSIDEVKKTISMIEENSQNGSEGESKIANGGSGMLPVEKGDMGNPWGSKKGGKRAEK